MCRQICVNEKEMKDHIKWDHRTYEMVEVPKPSLHNCVCGEVFDNTVLLKQHMFKTKHNIAGAKMQEHPVPNPEPTEVTDASDKAIGAVLQHLKDGAWQPLAFISRKLSPPQEKYSPYERELLAIYEGIKYFSLAKIAGFEHKWTAYHPACNDLVEHFHRKLKVAKVCHANDRWTESLPWVLLAIKTAFKEDLQSSSAKLVYGEPLRLLGEFFESATGVATDIIADKLRSTPMVWPSRHGSAKVFAYKDLATSGHVFLREDASRGSL
ncbi:hypothetical protein evm_008167 [Chilo suppressalis]|nr:hypothetical protein evm_008167 [Chilo suppressalis]